MHIEDTVIVKWILAGIATAMAWLFKVVWGDHKKQMEKIAKDIEAIKDQITELEKADVGVQIHLESLTELKVQLENLRNAVLRSAGKPNV